MINNIAPAFEVTSDIKKLAKKCKSKTQLKELLKNKKKIDVSEEMIPDYLFSKDEG